MPNLSSYDINAVVHEVLQRLQSHPDTAADGPLFDTAGQAVVAAKAAQNDWAELSNQSKAGVIKALRAAMHRHAEEFARLALEETGMGRLPDKIAKHHNSADATPGPEDLQPRAWQGDKGMVYDDYAPYGVIAAVTPSTHPIPVLFNSMIITISPGNAVVFNVHPAAKRVSARAVKIFNDVIVQNGGPANLVSMIKEPTLQSVNELFSHPDVALIAATGGPALVEAAFKSGKKVIAAGPGNPPVLVDETADLANAAKRIIEGASFDNNILCIAEKEVFVVRAALDGLVNELQRQGAILLNSDQMNRLQAEVFVKDEQGNTTVSRSFIGKNAAVLAAAAGLEVSDDVRLLVGLATFDCPFVQQEQMMPYLPIVAVADADEGIELAFQAEHGYGHTAMIHSNNLETITRFSRKMNTSIVVVNGSSLAGNGGSAGEGTFSHTIASPTGEGICTPRHFARVRRLAVSGALNLSGEYSK